MKFKRVIALILIFSIFVSNSIGVILVYNQIKFYHKRVIKTSIRNNSFTQLVEVLAFSKSGINEKIYDLKFLEENEFRFNGRMYDVISKWETQDSIFYKCINDTKEEELEFAFVQFVVNNNNRQDLPLPIKQILKSLNIDLFYSGFSSNFSNLNFDYLNFSSSDKLVIIYLEVPSPPPRILTSKYLS